MKWITVLAGIAVLAGCAGKQKSSDAKRPPVPETGLSSSEVDSVGAPVRGLEGVGSTPEAIHAVSLIRPSLG